MSQILDDIISVTHITGGMIEFERSGIYPNRLIIRSKKYGRRWIVNVKEERATGVLKKDKIAVYSFVFCDDAFKVRRDSEDVWHIVEDIIIEMRD